MSNSSRAQPVAFDAERYYHRSQRPLQALIFLLPLLALYELGTLYWAHREGVALPPNMAWSLLRGALEYLGATGNHLPALLVVVVLLVWHFARRDPWQFDGRLYLAMAVESLALAIPILVFALVVGRERAPLANPFDYPWQAQIVFSLGAGIYEELVFRLIAIALLHLVLVDLVGLKHGTGALIAIACSAVLFAGYHFSGPASFDLLKFVFYAVAGLYLAWLYVLRGFGIVVATHALYDIFIVAITHGLLPLG